MGWFSGPFAFVGWLIGLALYFLPTIIAIVRKKSNLLLILLLNIFLGWTLVGWIIALVLAVI
ncbi:MAG: superinfection immunity protein [Chloroflexi bacterium]|nr:superinfection immunity protein [Chloroflexota bacterium]